MIDMEQIEWIDMVNISLYILVYLKKSKANVWICSLLKNKY